MTAKLAMIGLDAAELGLIEANRHRLPTLARVLDLGAVHRLRSTADLLTGSVWPTFLTGSPPGVHGIYHHLQWDADAMRLRRVAPDWVGGEPFWVDLERRGRRVVALDVPMTFPSQLRHGVEITNWGSHDTLGPVRVQPHGLAPEIRRRFGRRHPMGWEIPVDKTPGELARIRRRLVEGAKRKGAFARWLLETQAWDVFLAVFGETHRGGHILWPEDGESPDPLLDVYRAVDDALGEILGGLGDDTTVVVFALHGMGPNLSQEHFMPQIIDRVNAGVAATDDPASGPAAGQRSPMRVLRERLPARLQNAVARAVPMAVRDRVVDRVVSGGHDWARTPAIALLADLNGYVRLNLRGREAEGTIDAEGARRYRDRLRRCLESLRIAESGAPLVRDLTPAHEAFPGARRDRLPDLVVRWSGAPPASRARSDLIGTIDAGLATGRGGNHRPDGFAAVLGPGRTEPAPGDVVGLVALARRLCLGPAASDR
jgi:predicted AlkP superfamily phosphohydrolase/phosphomutase